MGNTPTCPRIMGNGKYSSYHIKLDNAATVSMRKNEESDWEHWELKYDVNGMTCTLSMTMPRNPDHAICINHQDFYFKIQDQHPHAGLIVRVAKEKGCLLVKWTNSHGILTAEEVKKYDLSTRGEVETHYWAYGWGAKMRLLVIKKKKKKRSNEELPYMVTLAHYYVNSASGVDIGFSIVMEIGVHNGRLDFSVDGPVEHPSSALLYMIEEVTRTGTWTLSACPHCKNNQWKQRRWLSEREDSDDPLPPPPPRRYEGSQNAANMGRFNGDGNGSIFQATKINFIKWWK